MLKPRFLIPFALFCVITILALFIPELFWDGYDASAVTGIVSGIALMVLGIWALRVSPAINPTMTPVNRAGQRGVFAGLMLMASSRILDGVLHFLHANSDVQYLGTMSALALAPIVGIAVFVIAHQRLAERPPMPRSLKLLVVGTVILGITMIAWAIFSHLSLEFYGGILCITCPAMFLPTGVLYLLAFFFWLNESSKRDTKPTSQAGIDD